MPVDISEIPEGGIPVGTVGKNGRGAHMYG